MPSEERSVERVNVSRCCGVESLLRLVCARHRVGRAARAAVRAKGGLLAIVGSGPPHCRTLATVVGVIEGPSRGVAFSDGQLSSVVVGICRMPASGKPRYPWRRMPIDPDGAQWKICACQTH